MGKFHQDNDITPKVLDKKENCILSIIISCSVLVVKTKTALLGADEQRKHDLQVSQGDVGGRQPKVDYMMLLFVKMVFARIYREMYLDYMVCNASISFMDNCQDHLLKFPCSLTHANTANILFISKNLNCFGKTDFSTFSLRSNKNHSIQSTEYGKNTVFLLSRKIYSEYFKKLNVSDNSETKLNFGFG